MKLTFSTFGTALSHCTSLLDKELVSVLSKIVHPLSRYADEKEAAHKVLKGKINYVWYNDEGDVAKSKVIDEIEAKLVPNIQVDMREKLVLTLCDIIHKDETIDTDHIKSFEELLGKNKSAILRQHDYILSEFLAGLYLFSIKIVASKNGKTEAYVKAITLSYVEDLANRYRKLIQDDPDAKIIVFPTRDPFKVYTQAIKEYQIFDFVECDPIGSIEEILVCNAARFISTITNVLPMLTDRKGICRKIGHFNEIIDKYVICLGLNMRPLLLPTNDFLTLRKSYMPSDSGCIKSLRCLTQSLTCHKSVVFVPLYREENIKWALNFNKQTDNYRKQLIKLHDEICSLEHTE